jgi:hypothetical protein
MSFYFTNTVFQKLQEQYPTWEQLQDYLESEEGGLLRVTDHNEQSGLFLIRYEKGVSNMELPHTKWFRSVVWDRTTHSPVSVAPPKSSSLEFSFLTRQDANNQGVVIQEMLDGFMINCFKRVGDDTLYVTSRSRINASGQFHSMKSFRQLFVEAYTGQTVESAEQMEQIIQHLSFPSPNPMNQEIAIGCSFLVQHQEHRIVSTIPQNNVTLIHQTITHTDGTVLFQDTPDPSILPGIHAMPLSSIPMDSGSEEMNTWIHEQLRSQSWEVQGLVLKDTSGNRWRFRSDAYTAVRSLRGNTPFGLDRFVQLYLQNLVQPYLQYYPSDSDVFGGYLKMMNYMVRAIYEEYQQLHVRKTTTINNINKMYHPHLYALHGYYLSQLRPAHKKITLNEVYDYLRKQPWQRVAFLLREIQDIYYEMIRMNLIH